MIFYSPSIDDTYNLIVLVCIMFNNKITVLDDVWYHLVVSFVTDVQSVPLVWICNLDPLGIRIFNPPGSNELNRNSACGNKTATSSLS